MKKAQPFHILVSILLQFNEQSKGLSTVQNHIRPSVTGSGLLRSRMGQPALLEG